MRIRQEMLEQINKGDKANTIKAKLIEANDKHPGTIQRWIDKNDEALTNAKNLSIICEQLGVTQDQILEEESIAA